VIDPKAGIESQVSRNPTVLYRSPDLHIDKISTTGRLVTSLPPFTLRRRPLNHPDELISTSTISMNEFKQVHSPAQQRHVRLSSQVVDFWPPFGLRLHSMSPYLSTMQGTNQARDFAIEERLTAAPYGQSCKGALISEWRQKSKDMISWTRVMNIVGKMNLIRNRRCGLRGLK
jgi:hypothetical protein